MLERVEGVGLVPNEVQFRERECDPYDHCCDDVAGFELAYKEWEPDEIWQRKLAAYRKRLATWEAWAEEHQEEIEARLAQETAEKEDKLTALAERSHRTLEKERKNLEKRLKNLEKRLQK